MLAGCRVLVVEDEALVAEGITELLIGAEGVPVAPIATVREARLLIRQNPFLDAALLDVTGRKSQRWSGDARARSPECTGYPDCNLHGWSRSGGCSPASPRSGRALQACAACPSNTRPGNC